MAKESLASHSVSSSGVDSQFSPSEAVRWRTLPSVLNTKQPNMAIGFLLLITLDRAESLLLNAVLDNVNLMSSYDFCFFISLN